MEISSSELFKHRGEENSDIYIAVKGVIYDVTPSRQLYGPGGSYHVFAGKECSRALAMMKVDVSYCDANLEDLDEKAIKILEDWINKFNQKYNIIGKVIG